MRVALNTLGCRLNEAELESWSTDFQKLGYSVSSKLDDADIVVVNTCAVTSEAVKKSRQLLRKSQRLNPMAKLVVSGCYASLEPGSLENIDGIDLLVANRDKDRLVNIVNEQLIGESMPLNATEPGESVVFSRARTRAFVKVQDGCRYRCAFCIVTIARGAESSKPAGRVIEEINELVSRGVKEVILTGVHIGGYGSDIGSNIGKLVQAILDETDLPRLRLGSIEPWDLGSDFVGLFSNPRFMPHLHLPLQSGSDSVLRRMSRRCLTADYADLLTEIRSRVKGFTVTTDIIVGFPGETAEEWQESLDFIDSCQFSHIHIFPYSAREGTRAARMSEQLSTQVKKQRSKALNAQAETMRKQIMNNFVEHQYPVLFESANFNDQTSSYEYLGYTPNYLRVKLLSHTNLGIDNQILNTRLLGYDEKSRIMRAELVDTTG